MPAEIIQKEKYDIFTWPDEASIPAPGTAGEVLVIGDLHANAITDMITMVQEGVITLKNGKADFDEAVRIYKNVSDVTREDLDSLYTIIDNIQLRDQRTIIRLGDNYSDRGQCDLYEFRFTRKLEELGVKHIDIWSNHPEPHFDVMNKEDRLRRWLD